VHIRDGGDVVDDGTRVMGEITTAYLGVAADGVCAVDANVGVRVDSDQDVADICVNGPWQRFGGRGATQKVVREEPITRISRKQYISTQPRALQCKKKK
jgi:hypothetical protein